MPVAGQGKLAGEAVASGHVNRLTTVHIPGIVLQHQDRGLTQGAPAQRIEIPYVDP